MRDVVTAHLDKNLLRDKKKEVYLEQKSTISLLTGTILIFIESFWNAYRPQQTYGQRNKLMSFNIFKRPNSKNQWR